MNFTVDLRSTQANNIGFYFARKIYSVNVDFSVSTFLSQRPSQISKKHLHFLIQIKSLIISAQVQNWCTLHAPPTLQLKWKQTWFLTISTDILSIIKMQKHWLSWSTKLKKELRSEVAFCCYMHYYMSL